MGFVNMMAVKDWIIQNHSAPESIFVSGGSAGAYGARFGLIHMIDQYSDVSNVITGVMDAGAGIIPHDWLVENLPDWGAWDNRPMWIPALAAKTLDDMSMKELMIDVLNYYPDYLFAEYNTYSDGTQKLFYGMMGGDNDDWTGLMVESSEDISMSTSNYRFFIDKGSVHTIMTGDAFYQNEVDGVYFKDWVNTLAKGGDVQNIQCTDCE